MTTATQADTAIITTRSRNLGFEWTNSAEETWNDNYTATYLRIKTPPATSPMRVGLRGVWRELERASRGNNGNEWRSALYVGGRRVTAVRMGFIDERTNRFVPHSGWVTNSPVKETLSLIKPGDAVEVRLVSVE